MSGEQTDLHDVRDGEKIDTIEEGREEEKKNAEEFGEPLKGDK
jgi:hypothetical protein